MKVKKIEPNLYIQTNKSGRESWMARFKIDGKDVWRGLGLCKYVSKTQARSDMLRLKSALQTGIAPLTIRTAPTFEEILIPAIDDIQTSKQWKTEQMRQRWVQTLTDYALPHLGKIHVDKIEAADILKTLKPIWTTKPVLASRLRMRIEAVLNWCALMKHRSGPNPASWRGNLEFALPQTAKIHKVKHHEALTMDEVKTVVRYCKDHPSTVSGVLLFVIATVGRVSECIKVRRSEIEGDVWVVPADRMKAGKTHRVPLTAMAFTALRMGQERTEIIFKGVRSNHVAVDSPRLKLCAILNRKVTCHGIRSTFKDWCSREGVDEIVSELSLAHKWGNAVTSAYLRDDLLKRRLELLKKWEKVVS